MTVVGAAWQGGGLQAPRWRWRPSESSVCSS